MDLIQLLHIALALVVLVAPAAGIVIAIAQRTKHPGGTALVAIGCVLLLTSAVTQLAWLLVVNFQLVEIDQLNLIGLVANVVDSLTTALGIVLLVVAGVRRGSPGPVPAPSPVPPPPPPVQPQWGQWGAPRS
ncbi:MAG TPA: hypothetical protein VIL34_21795 [Actinopolymorphaceae bacterium]|jgi:uncharacterized membrane protein